MIAPRVDLMQESQTLAISARAKVLRAEGKDVVGFGAGEPDFDTPAFIKEKAKEAIEKGFTKYTPASGIKELKEAVKEKFLRDNNLAYDIDQIIIGSGAKYLIFEALFSLLEEGNEVIIPVPYWLSYPQMVTACGARSVFVNTASENNFKLTAENLSAAITSRTRILILNSPSNPTGSVYEEAELKKIAKIIVENDIFCISDEIYEKLVYDGVSHVSVASLSEEIKKKTIVINGMSKAYAMTGWRIGYAAGPPEVIKAISKLQSHTTSCPSSISQYAALAALEVPQDEVGAMVSEFEKRRNYMVDKLNSIEGIKCGLPQGTFYCFADISSLFGKSAGGEIINSSLDFSRLLLEHALVAVVPGVVFGDDKFIRFSYAASFSNMKKGLERLESFVRALQ
ncbi:MAG: pyridoxal phosphate-dependent aminotransferase [Candidatus Omnitrophica bacterium]|nr:pyridoxal phosphate-dependent aminotransferase [Candidatus Omnitrophota bacterium]